MSGEAIIRVKSADLEAALANFRDMGIEPSHVQEGGDETHFLTFTGLIQVQEEQFAAACDPNHFASIGLMGRNPFEERH